MVNEIVGKELLQMIQIHLIKNHVNYSKDQLSFFIVSHYSAP